MTRRSVSRGTHLVLGPPKRPRVTHSYKLDRIFIDTATSSSLSLSLERERERERERVRSAERESERVRERERKEEKEREGGKEREHERERGRKGEREEERERRSRPLDETLCRFSDFGGCSLSSRADPHGNVSDPLLKSPRPLFHHVAKPHGILNGQTGGLLALYLGWNLAPDSDSFGKFPFRFF